MLVRNQLLFKWALYGAAAVLCMLIQGTVLQRITLWGVIPFLYPLLAAIPATYEGPTGGTVFALAVGVLTDLLLPAPLPCFYTLVFPLVGLCAALLSQGLLRSGFLCSLASGIPAFLLTGGFHCLLLWINREPVWPVGGILLLRELCISLPLAIPLTVLFLAVHRRVHADD